MRSIRLLPLVTLLLVAAADWGLWQAPSGWCWSALFAALTGSVAWHFRVALRHSAGRWMLALVVVADVAMFLEPGWLAACLMLLGLSALTQMDRPFPQASPLAWLRGLAWRLVRQGVRWIPDLVTARNAQKHRAARGGQRGGISLKKLLLHWGLPVIGTLVFARLFAWASPVWEGWWRQGWEALSRLLSFKWPDWLTFGRVGFWALSVAWLWGWWRTRMTVRASGRLAEAAPRWALSTGLVVRCLGMFTALFAVQLVLDSQYLLLGAALPKGMNHAQYAHRGAYPLMVTALLAGAFTLLAFRPHGPARQSPWARRLIGVFIMQNILLLLSAAWRLFVYMDAFGLTRWRLAAAVWMLLVGGGLALVLAHIFLRKDTLWLRWKVAQMTLPVLLACALFPVNRVICAWNARQPTALLFDVDYMASLGVEAIPGLRQAEDNLRQAGDMKTADRAKVRRIQLENELYALRQNLRGWTPRRALIELPADFKPGTANKFRWGVGGIGATRPGDRRFGEQW